MFSKALKMYRNKNGLTQEKVVLILQRYGDFLSTNTISYHSWETGKVTPQIQKQAQIMLLLNNRDSLKDICKYSNFAYNEFKAFLQKRWFVRRYGHDYFYNFPNNDLLTIKELDHLSEFPDLVKYSQYNIYYDDHPVSPDYLDALVIHNKILLFQNTELIQGHIAIHTILASKLANYITKFEGDMINQLPCIDNEVILFVSTIHASQETTSLLIIKEAIEFMIPLNDIPRFCYIRIFGDNANKFFEKKLSPILITMGKGKCQRVCKNNQKAAYLGYVVPTHLLLLLYGNVLKQLELISS